MGKPVVYQFCAYGKYWRIVYEYGKLDSDGIEFADGVPAGIPEKVLLIVVQNIESLERNPEFVKAISEKAKEAIHIYIDRLSDNNIKAFDASLYKTIDKPIKMHL